MKKYFDAKFKTNVTMLAQGDYFVSKNAEILVTTLGSCVSVCLFDPDARVGGMNHYMLPEPAIERDELIFSKAKYGIISMERMLNELLKLGAVKKRVIAKVFGGANMIQYEQESHALESVGAQNVAFAEKYLLTEDIKISTQDVRGDHARKIYFDTGTGRVKLFRIDSQLKTALKQKELSYYQRIQADNQADEQADELDTKITFY